MALYSQGDCNNDEETFDKISLKVYDSIATSINITGETDLEPKESECPIKCFETDMTYYIKNIDTNTLTGNYSTTIINDPRLKAYKVKYNDVEIDDSISQEQFCNMTIKLVDGNYRIVSTDYCNL